MKFYKERYKKKSKKVSLHHAASDGDLNKLMHLLRKGIDIDAVDVSGESALFKAVGCVDFECVKLLVTEGADVNMRSRDWRTPLHLAAALNLPEFINYFIDNGANVNAKTKIGLTPLHVSVSKCSTDSVKTLLKRGACINAETIAGRTALHIAVSKSEDCIEILMNEGAELGISPLEVALEFGLEYYATDNQCLPYMIEYGCDVNVEDNNGDTPLHFACFRGNPIEDQFSTPMSPAVEMLVLAGADVNKKNKMGLAPVHIYAKFGCWLSLQNIHILMCDLNLRGGSKNYTPLHFASKGGHFCCIQYLLENEVDKARVDTDNCTALMLAAKNNHFSCVKLLLQNDVPLWAAS